MRQCFILHVKWWYAFLNFIQQRMGVRERIVQTGFIFNIWSLVLQIESLQTFLKLKVYYSGGTLFLHKELHLELAAPPLLNLSLHYIQGTQC